MYDQDIGKEASYPSKNRDSSIAFSRGFGDKIANVHLAIRFPICIRLSGWCRRVEMENNLQTQ